jgi:hypothetical protein
MRLLCTVLPFLGASCSVFGGGTAVRLHGGWRDLSSDTATISNTNIYGLDASVGVLSGWGVEGAFFYGQEDGDDLGGFRPELEQSELSVGIRKTFLDNLPVSLYVGGGVAYTDADLSGLPAPDISDDGVGGYLHAGVVASVLGFQAGIDVRGLVTDVEIGDDDLSYVQGTIFIGIGF